jgi:hypothetical protein
MAIFSASGALGKTSDPLPTVQRLTEIGERQEFGTLEFLGESVDESMTGTGTLVQDIQAERLAEYRGLRDTSRLRGIAGTYVDIFGVDEEKRKKLTEESYKESEYFRPSIRYRKGMTVGEAQILSEREDERNRLGLMLDKAGTAETVAGFTVGLGAAIFEPKNLVSGVAAFGLVRAPLVGLSSTSTRYKSLKNYMNAKVGAKYGGAAALATRGGLEGAIAVGITEAGSRESALAVGDDYTMTDTLLNFVTSVAFSAGIEGGGAVIKSFRLNKQMQLAKKQAVEAGITNLRKKGVEFDQAYEDGPALKGIEVEGVAADKMRLMDQNAHAEASELAQTQLQEGKVVDISPVIDRQGAEIEGDIDTLSQGLSNKYQEAISLKQAESGNLVLGKIKKKNIDQVIEDIKAYSDRTGKIIEATPTKATRAAYEQAGFREVEGKLVREPNRAGSDFSPDKVRRVTESLTDPKRSSTYNAEAIQTVDDYNKQFSEPLTNEALAKEIDEVGFDVEALREAGLLEGEFEDVLKYYDDLVKDATKYTEAIDTAAFCLTKG